MKVVRDLFKYSTSFRVGAILLIIMLVIASLSFFAPYQPDERRVVPKDRPPSAEYPLGTTSLGQDVFWLLTFTVRNSLIIAGLAVIIGRSIALALGSVSAYAGGTTDRVLSGFADAFIVIPRLPLLLLISFILKDQLTFVQLGILLGLLDWAWPSKRYRSQILTLREEEFTQTAVFSGASTPKVILGEHFPFLIPFTLADAVTGFLWAIGAEITLSILGVSDLATPTIGTMIYWASYYQAMLARKFWWLAAPIIASILIVIAFYLLSTSLSEYLDPRTRLKRLVVTEE
jgi:peptide/nickel transport system permease protein